MKTKTITVSYKITVNLSEYMREYDVDAQEAVAMIKQQCEDGGRATLDNGTYAFIVEPAPKSIIKWTKINTEGLTYEAYRTNDFRGLMSNSFYGRVEHSLMSGLWTGWVIYPNNTNMSEFKLDMPSKKAATRWVNAKLHTKGVK